MNNGHYDPMTGQFIPDSNEQEVHYDPMTGQPIYNQNNEQNNQMFQNENGYQYGNEMFTDGNGFGPINVSSNEKNSHKKGITLALVSVFVVAVILVFQLFRSGVFGGKMGRIQAAFKNTMELDHFGKALSFYDEIVDGNYGANISFEVEGVEAEMDYIVNLDKKQQYLSTKFNYQGINLEAIGALTKNEVQLQIPVISDNIYTYDYTKDKDGDIYSLAEEAGVDLEAIDKVLQKFNQKSGLKNFKDDFKKATKKVVKAWNVKDAKKEDCYVDGKMRSCKGYELTINSDDILDLIDAYENIVEDYTEESISMFEDFMDENLYGYDDPLDELKDAFDDMPELSVQIYLYKNQIAKIVITSEEDEDGEICIEFFGGKVPTQNMKISIDTGYQRYKIEKETKVSGSMEQTEYSVMGQTMLKVDYDFKSGDFKIQSGSILDDAFAVRGNLLKDKSGTKLTIDRIKVYDESVDFKLSLSIDNAGKVPELKGKKIDIGSLSEEELADEIYDIEQSIDQLTDFDYGYNSFW